MDNQGMNNETAQIVTKKKNKWFLFAIIGIVLIIIGVVVGVLVYFKSSSNPQKQLQKQLNLGDKYLTDMDYENAVLAYKAAIEIEPKSADGYIGLAKAYIGLEDINSAMGILEKGYSITNDQRLADMLEDLKKKTNEKNTVDIENETEDFSDLAEKIEKAHNSDAYSYVYFMSEAERKKVFGELAEELENYIYDIENNIGKYQGKQGYPSLLDSYVALSEAYLRMGDMEKCLETRKKLAAFQEDDSILQEEYSVSGESSEGDKYYCKIDKYGRTLEQIVNDESDHQSYQYDGNRLVFVERHYQTKYTVDGKLEEIINMHDKYSYTYDESGRASEINYIVLEGRGKGYIGIFDYSENGKIYLLDKDDTNQVISMYSLNEYGYATYEKGGFTR